ncbi:putative DsbA family dithiol-disulfide isomerase [Rhodobium orientis]|uniref:Disulfide bond formation protein DsbA n=1 Tax=Rhodobium orientis TaxID=34017 RepID=A0A327JSE8_9HYPH|nr:DsbA family oxidoreductase [Rhodobium orientis]MBB4302289.1 putative DsbA family dithiol-disulfide isomerase [Rhodobium orientis]MBK5948999.1 disulfide bond formation protein DsbA [Rhodobium orientis]RAI28991.1 disulfide bond formation protein DsbA [Rhodobium orientis]
MTDDELKKSVLPIDVVSDVMCPWCFIGKRRLANALEKAADVPVLVRWRPFQLDATLPPEGKDYRRYHEDKFGSAEKVDALRARVTEAGRAEGLDFKLDAIPRAPNTLNAHRLIRWAGPVGAQNKLVELLFSLYFLEGADLTDDAVLAEAADACGMAKDRALELLATDQDVEAVQTDIAVAQRMGINSVPTFVIADRYAVVGAQEADTLARAIREAWIERSEQAEFTVPSGT